MLFLSQLKTLYQINLVRIPTQALSAVQLVENQVANVPGAQNISVDLIWINLEVSVINFVVVVVVIVILYILTYLIYIINCLVAVVLFYSI